MRTRVAKTKPWVAVAILVIIVLAGALGAFVYWTNVQQNAHTQGNQTTTSNTGTQTQQTSQTSSTSIAPNPNATVSYVGPALFSGGGQQGSEITVPLGTTVQVSIALSSNAPTSGLLQVEVRRDVVWGSDNTMQTLQKQVGLTAGQNNMTMGTFTATDATCGNPGCVREYFIKVWWNNQVIYDPTNPNTREWVQTTTSGGGYGGVQYNGPAQFSGAGLTGAQITVPVNTMVDVKINLQATGPTSGPIVVDVRKDIVWGSDQSLVQLTKTVTLVAGANTIDMGKFTASDTTSGNPFSVREYFITVSFNGQMIYNPTDPGSREWVKTTTGSVSAHPIGVNYVPSATFSGAGQSGSQITVPVGTSVDLKIQVVANGTGSAVISVDVRKDIIWASDVSYATLTKTVTVGTGTQTVDMGTFTAIDQTGSWPGNVREYFFTVSVNGSLIYNPTDPGSREWVKTSSGSSVSTTTTGPAASQLTYVFPATFTDQSGTPSGSQITVPVGDTVDAKIVLNNPGNQNINNVQVSADIRKDVVWGSDSTLVTLTKTITAYPGRNTIDLGTFTASDQTGGGIGQVREYFIRVSVQGILIYNPTDPTSRENVQTTQSVAQPVTVSYVSAVFSGAGQTGSQITVPVGTQVTATITVSANVAGSGTIGIDIRKDIVWSPDSTLLTCSKQASVTAGTNTFTCTFTASDHTGGWPGNVREYFVRVSWNGNLIYDPTNPSTREWVQTK
jgi:hypothetical protein